MTSWQKMVVYFEMRNVHATPTYHEAVLNTERVLIKGRVTKADVFITRLDDRRVIVKDYSRKGFWERNLIGRIVIGREARAYAALAGIEGLPAWFRRLSPFAFAVEYLDGQDLGSLAPGPHWAGVIGQFERIVNELHERGWVHLDLHRRTNILLVEGKVFVVDLASALHTGSIPLLGGPFTRLAGLADSLSLIKLKTIFAPGLMTEREKKWLKLRNRWMPTKWRAD
jgi:predicted Ser/Thr protein kinase